MVPSLFFLASTILLYTLLFFFLVHDDASLSSSPYNIHIISIPKATTKETADEEGVGVTYDDDDDDQIDLWNQRFFNSGDDHHSSTTENNKKYVFFKHVRKAGGTTMRNYLNKVLKYHNNNNNNNNQDNGTFVHYYEQEYGATDHRCPTVDAQRWNHTIRVIVLRHPIERHLSEFFYSEIALSIREDDEESDSFDGVATNKQRKRLHELQQSKTYDEEFYALLNKTIPPWMEYGKRQVRKYGRLFQHFSDEYQVRTLSGVTTEVPKHCNDTSSSSSSSSLCDDEWDSPCYYGGGYKHGGTPTFQNTITNVEYERAKHLLHQFDLILLTETLTNDEEQVQYVSDVLNVPNNDKVKERISLASSKKKVYDSSGKSNMLDGMKQHTPDLVELLQQHSYYETRLYEEAIEINYQRIQNWRKQQRRRRHNE